MYKRKHVTRHEKVKWIPVVQWTDHQIAVATVIQWYQRGLVEQCCEGLLQTPTNQQEEKS